jgi:hypothetical protein
MYKIIIVIFFINLTLIAPAHAQQISESWLKTAGALCAGRFSAEVSAEGEATISKWFSFISPGAEGHASIEVTDLNRLLAEFSGVSKENTLTRYFTCLEGFLAAALSPAGIQPGQIVLAPDFVPPSIDIIPNGSRFLIKPQQTVGLVSAVNLVTLTEIRSDRGLFTFTNLKTGKNSSRQLVQGGSTEWEGCRFVVYDLLPKKPELAVLLACESE